MLMGKNILTFQECAARDGIASRGSSTPADCSLLSCGLANAGGLGAVSPSQSGLIDWVTYWEAFPARCLWDCIFSFWTALTCDACVKEQVLKGGQFDGRIVIKSCSQMLLSLPELFLCLFGMYCCLEDVFFSDGMILYTAGLFAVK